MRWIPNVNDRDNPKTFDNISGALVHANETGFPIFRDSFGNLLLVTDEGWVDQELVFWRAGSCHIGLPVAATEFTSLTFNGGA